ncbi:hypothetical protein N0V90_007225 [Kalmusia sp. IMI 367209]|nr:hypothetical protein N0V90_007225 [Kalmusia sp. IMI 367209]
MPIVGEIFNNCFRLLKTYLSGYQHEGMTSVPYGSAETDNEAARALVSMRQSAQTMQRDKSSKLDASHMPKMPLAMTANQDPRLAAQKGTNRPQYLQNQIWEMRSTRNKNNGWAQNLKRHNRELKNDNKSLSQQSEVQAEQIRQLRVRMKDVDLENKEMFARLYDMNQEITQLENEKLSLKAVISELHDEDQRKSSQIQELAAEGQRMYAMQYELEVEVKNNLAEKQQQSTNLSGTTTLLQSIYERCLLPYASDKSIKLNINNLTSINQISDALPQGCTKEKLFSGPEKIQAIEDWQFQQDFNALAGEIKSLGRYSDLPRRPSVLEVNGILNALLLKDVDTALLEKSIRREDIIEAYIWSTLYENVFCSPFHVLGSDYEELRALFGRIFGTDHYFDWPIPSSSSECWRYTTMEHFVASIRKGDGVSSLITSEDPLLESSIDSHREHILKLIEGTLLLLWPQLDLVRITLIIDTAFNLALQMALQQCRIQVIFPSLEDIYIASESPYPELKSVPESSAVPIGKGGIHREPGAREVGRCLWEKLRQAP